MSYATCTACGHHYEDAVLRDVRRHLATLIIERDQLKARAEKAEGALAALHAKWPFLAVDLPEASEETSAEVDALVRSIYASRPKRVIRPARAKPYEEKQP